MTGRHRAPAGHIRTVRLVLTAALAVATLIAVAVITDVRQWVPTSAVAGTPRSAPASWAPAAPTTATPVPRPTRVRIPAIDVDGPIIDISTDDTGALIPPDTTDVVGWFTGGPAPGDIGPALLAAHVDSHAGPGVFFRLVELEPGDRITVDRVDGSTTTFSVVSTTRVARTAFPTELVYAPVPVPVLRLITCGGAFDRAARSYRDNIIVDAELVT